MPGLAQLTLYKESLKKRSMPMRLRSDILDAILCCSDFFYARMGWTDETGRLLEEMNELMQKNYVPGTVFGMIYFGLGEMDKTFDWFERGVEERHSVILFLIPLPVFDPLRSHPRYKTLLRKMNLEACADTSLPRISCYPYIRLLNLAESLLPR